MIVENFPDRTIQVEGKEYLYFGGTAYLGLSTNASFLKILTQSITKWGSFYGSSRSSNIKLSIFNTAEAFFAEQIGAEAAVTTSSGTLAGKLVLDYLSQSDYTFYHYPKTHPAILHPNSLPVFVNGQLHPNLRNTTNENIVITVDAVLALEVEPTSFDFLNNISSEKKVTLVVDESHSLGIFGKQGQGVFSSILSEKLERKIMVSSLGKALGLSGGIIASDNDFIDSIKNEILFISSSCANAGYLEAYLQSQDLIHQQQKKLKENLAFLFDDFKPKERFKFSKNYPVIYCNEDGFYDYLYKNNIIITNFKYPNYEGFMSRIVISANHTQEDLEILKHALIHRL
ncbi:aminotransferase class I/II-fold pyridoxal phosphate-dependent enzyme [Yeosuana marina]|uniref:aminotransferase class I/II-fold pyridoxal phosphate-dependent enzyme n=1 Tax=Yeosuana marina TaxID=1565536 RepID=UPI001421DB5E|nr:aminotransferase class I/II-fold pyridoxal phosphate-dependent enzyme [Yeosuana marina]